MQHLRHVLASRKILPNGLSVQSKTYINTSRSPTLSRYKITMEKFPSTSKQESKISIGKNESVFTSSVSETAMNSESPVYHTLTALQTAKALQTDPQNGLSTQEATARLQFYGPNQLHQEEGVSVLKVFIRQVCNAMILVLVISMAISFGIQDWIAGGVIAGVIGINVFVGFIQEFKAEKTMESLRGLSSPTARIIRDGSDNTIPSGDVVPGDVIVVKVGDTVPADCRILDSMNFETDEALLTGESLPVSKNPNLVFELSAPVGDRINMAFSSCIVTKGRATAIVTSTGMDTEIGVIAKSLSSQNKGYRPVKRDEFGKARKRDYAGAIMGTIKDAVGAFLGTTVGTPLHRKLAQLAIFLFGVAVVFAIVVMAAQKFKVNREVAVYAIAVALSMIPSSLVVVLTITMAVGTKVMVKRNVIVRKLDSLEALGAVNDICSDKTGTLTQGKMVAKKVWIPTIGTYQIIKTNEPFNPTAGSITFSPNEPKYDITEEDVNLEPPQQNSSKFEQWLNVASLANIANVHQSKDDEGELVWKATGDPTEIAIQVFVSRFNWQRSRWTEATEDSQPEFVHLAEFPFDSSIKRMTAVYQSKSGPVHILTKGAVERVIGCCTTWYGEGDEIKELTKDDQDQILANMEAFAKEGLVSITE